MNSSTGSLRNSWVKRTHVVEHHVESKWCPTCQQISHASFPQGVVASVQYGPAFAATAVYLVTQHFLPTERACELMHEQTQKYFSWDRYCEILEKKYQVLNVRMEVRGFEHGKALIVKSSQDIDAT